MFRDRVRAKGAEMALGRRVGTRAIRAPERRLSDAGKLPPPAPKGRRRVAPGKARGNAASPPPSPGGAARTCRS